MTRNNGPEDSQDRGRVRTIFFSLNVIRKWTKMHRIRLEWEERHAYVVLVTISIIIGVLSVLASVHEIQVNNQKFCDVLATAVPAPKPENPKADPSRERAYEGYLKVSKLSHNLGCS